MNVADRIVMKDPKTLKRAPYNPRKHPQRAVNMLVHQVERFGFTNPIIVQKGTDLIIAGHVRQETAIRLNMNEVPCIEWDVNDDEAKMMNIADNRVHEETSWDFPKLVELLQELDTGAVDLIDTGFDSQQIEKFMTWTPPPAGAVPSFEPNGLPAQPDAGRTSVGKATQKAAEKAASLDAAPETLQGTLELKESIVFPSLNQWGIPELREDMLVEELPPNLKTWGNKEASPDDGSSWFLFNYGVSSQVGLPWNRAILCFYTYDTKFENWWLYPAFQTSKAINKGIKMAVVPDFSIWTDDPPIMQMFNVYRAQWLGRYFQEAGIRVIPRLQWSNERSFDFCLLGIPQNPPVAAMCVQTIDKNNPAEMQLCRDGMKRAYEEIKPKQLIVYSGKPGHDIAREVLGTANVELVLLENYAAVRRNAGVFGKQERF